MHQGHQPGWCLGERNEIGVMVNRDCVISSADVTRGRGHDVSALPPDIYSRAKFARTVRNEPAGMAEYDVLATATREKPPGLRQGTICPFKGGKTVRRHRAGDRYRGG